MASISYFGSLLFFCIIILIGYILAKFLNSLQPKNKKMIFADIILGGEIKKNYFLILGILHLWKKCTSFDYSLVKGVGSACDLVYK